MFLTVQKDTNHRALILLSSGALLGIFLALIAPRWMVYQEQDVIASVNNSVIDQQQYHQALLLFSQEKRHTVTNTDRILVLNKLIEEELLVQYAISIDALRKDPITRQRILQTLLDTLQNQSFDDTQTVQNATLRDYISQLRENATITRLSVTAYVDPSDIEKP
ncbi:MAG: hypothetical protein P8Q37_00830 [Porticoccaceae bacterium]|nr:hypothetical protein [Porticoccaceae bacterium]MDG1473420.1 hypothetical protein [Porticoccaceae bacterium]